MNKRLCEMVASRRVELPYYRGVGRQRWKGFGALVQYIGRTANPFLRKFIVLATVRIVTNMLEDAVLEMADFVSGNKNNKSAAINAGRQSLRKQLCGGGIRKRSGSRLIPTNSSKRSSRSRKDNFTYVAIWLGLLKKFDTNLLLPFRVTL